MSDSEQLQDVSGEDVVCDSADKKNNIPPEEDSGDDKEKQSVAETENQQNEVEVKKSVNGEAKLKNDGFLSPLSLPPVAKPVKKQDTTANSPVSMTFHSKFAIPADIYKAPKVAAFMVDMPSKPKKESTQKKEAKVGENTCTIEPKAEKAKPKPPPAKLTYEAPDWSSEPEDGKYSLEVLKMGTIVDKVDLWGKEFFLVGRLLDCDIKMEHPSISRYHAVLQYGAPGPESKNVELQKDGSHGFYVYDLGSTHGSIINKQTVRGKIFYRIKVGHVIKFGGSTRLFILQGPSEDQEEEARETATELRKMNRQKIKKKKDLEKMMLGEDSSSDEDEKKEKKNERSTESSGVTWGMLEDAVQGSSDEGEEEEEEGPGDSREDHPDAITVHVKKDPFYMKDPLKALKTLYEREKMELDFECSERRSGHWHVRLCLPVDGSGGKPVYSEVNATGKKKDTIRQCALEACRVLERHGIFHRKDHRKELIKQWEKDDFYESDEDEFHDRTGELEMKRKLRMKRLGKSLKGTKLVETYESLVKKVTDLDNEVKDIEAKLLKDREATKVSTDSIDPLDAFMQQVKSGKALDTTTKAKLKRRLFEAKKEHMRMSKLADLARPSSLPPLASSHSKTYSFIGKMKGKPKSAANVRTVVNPEVLDKDADDKNEEEEEDGESGKTELQAKPTKFVKLMDVTSSKGETPSNSDMIVNKTVNCEQNERTENTPANDLQLETNANSDSNSQISVAENLQTDSNSQGEQIASQKVVETKQETKKRVLGPMLPPEVKEQWLAEPDVPAEQENNEEETAEPKRKRRRPRKPRPTLSSTPAQYSDDPKYSVWLPPEDQSGDGKISLNEKLGY